MSPVASGAVAHGGLGAAVAFDDDGSEELADMLQLLGV
jgi:hypothetical protein